MGTALFILHIFFESVFGDCSLSPVHLASAALYGLLIFDVIGRSRVHFPLPQRMLGPVTIATVVTLGRLSERPRFAKMNLLSEQKVTTV